MEYTDTKRVIKRSGKTVVLCRERLPQPRLTSDKTMCDAFRGFCERKLAPLCERDTKADFVPAVAELYAVRREKSQNCYELRVTLPDGSVVIKTVEPLLVKQNPSKKEKKQKQAH